MMQKESGRWGSIISGFSEDKLFEVSWHLKVLAIIYGCLILSYILLNLFLK